MYNSSKLGLAEMFKAALRDFVIAAVFSTINLSMMAINIYIYSISRYHIIGAGSCLR